MSAATPRTATSATRLFLQSLLAHDPAQRTWLGPGQATLYRSRSLLGHAVQLLGAQAADAIAASQLLPPPMSTLSGIKADNQHPFTNAAARTRASAGK